MKINWNVDHVINECRKMHRGAVDPYATGWVNWPCKQDLYRVKLAVEEMLANSPTFADEPEWLAEQIAQQEKRKIWKALNDL